MKTFPVDDVPGLGEQLLSGEEILLTAGHKVLGKAVPLFVTDSGAPLDFSNLKGVPRTAGSLKGMWIADPYFDPGSAANSTVRAVAAQNNHRLILGGDFTSYNGYSHNKVTRIHGK